MCDLKTAIHEWRAWTPNKPLCALRRCYLCSEPDSSERIIFTGDTLFIGGCGRCFAGTPQQMYSSLIGTLSKLPPDIKVRLLWG